MVKVDMRSLGRLLLIVAAVIAADQLCKWYMLEVVGIAHRPAIVIAPFFQLVMVWNRGISFGLFNTPGADNVLPLVAIAVGISGLLFWLALKSPRRWEQVGYCLVVGGALGNVVDRLRFGAVADFFYAHIGDLGWPAFNIADAAICVGVGLLLLLMLKPARPPLN